MRHTTRMTAMLISGLLLSGCSGSGGLSTSDGGAAAHADQGISPAEMAAMDAQARALREGQSGPGKVTPLTVPSPQAGNDGGPAGRVIYFDYDSDVIQEQYRPIVEASVNYLISHKGSTATLEGHTDERGSREYNLALGERRANAVRQQLNAMGVDANQVRTVSFGEERPTSPGHDETAYGQNRRVEIGY